MDWGSAFASAYGAASATAKAAAQAAAHTAQTAWDYTKQKAQDLQQSASESASAAQQQAQQAQEWAGQKANEAIVKTKQAGARIADTAGKTSDAVNGAFKKIGSSFSSAPAGASQTSCPLANPPALPPPGRGDGTCKPPPPCLLQPLSIKCGHGERAFLLAPPNTPTNEQHDQLIQVIADKNGRDQIQISFAAGSCPEGNGRGLPCLRFGDQSATGAVTYSLAGPPTPLRQEQSSDFVGQRIPLAEFVRFFMSRCDVGYQSYNGRIECCQGKGADQSFQVQVFPQRKWSGKIQAGVEVPGVTKTHSVSRAKLVFKGELNGTYGEREAKFSSPSLEVGEWHAKREIGGANVAFAVTRRWLSFVEPAIAKLNKFKDVKLEAEWPNLSLGGGMESVEVKGRYDVAWKGEIALKLDPLFGLKGTFDLLQMLINGGCHVYLPPGVSTVVANQIRTIREKAEKGIGSGNFAAKGVARVDFIAKGTVGGDFKWEFLPSGRNKVSGTYLQGDIDMTLEGKVSIEGRFWKVSYQAGITVSGEYGISGNLTACFYGDDPAFGGGAKMKALKIKALAYHSIGGSSIGTEREGQAAAAKRKAAKKKGKFLGLFDVNRDSARAEDTSTWEIVLIEEVVLAGGEPAEKGFGGGGASGSYTSLSAGI